MGGVGEAFRNYGYIPYETENMEIKFFCKKVLIVYFAAQVDLKQKDNIF